MDKQTNNTHLLNIVIQLTRIADELEKANKKKEEEEALYPYRVSFFICRFLGFKFLFVIF